MAARDPIKDHYFEANLFRARAITAGVVGFALILLLLGRLYYLQEISHRHFSTLSTNNRVRLMAVAPTRGLIYDRNGVLLADNMPTYRLEITPESVPDMDVTLGALRDVIEFSDDDVSRFRRALRRKRPFEGVALRTNLGDGDVARAAANRHRFPGVDIAARLGREYPLGELTGHVLGYVGRIDERELRVLDANNYSGTSYVGKTGVEKYYEDLLHGTVGFRQVEVNAEGRVLRVLEETPPVPGNDLYLTIDARLQQAARAALANFSGAVVALDPRNGDVLALVSAPSFDPNLFADGISLANYRDLAEGERRPLFNRALSGQYPPGSIVKPFIALAALESGVPTARQRVVCRGSYQLPNDERRYRDWKKHGHGLVDLGASITQSCDVFFYDLALRTGIDRISPFLARFGFGEPTGIDTPGEAAGILPSREWKRRERSQPWFPGETVITGIGQGYLNATPLQLAVATATLANRGRRVRPRMLAKVGGPRTDLAAPESPGVIELQNPAHWEEVVRAMRDVVHEPRGTAYWAHRNLRYQAAGKTGTAQVVAIAQDEEYDEDKISRRLRDHALYVSFAPIDAPRIAVAVLVEHGGSGGSVAAPVARQVLDDWLLRDEGVSAAVVGGSG